MPSFVPCATAEPARWIHARLGRFARGVTSVVPGGFDSYVRILHTFEAPDGSSVDPPDPGDLPADIAHVLADILAEHTTTTDECFYAIWDGWHVQPPQGRRASFRIPGRRLHLYTAPLTAAAERFPAAEPLFTHSPNLWWPADQAWCVATEIDLTCTYVGCSNVAEHHLVNSPLTAISVAPDDPVSISADPHSP